MSISSEVLVYTLFSLTKSDDDPLSYHQSANRLSCSFDRFSEYRLDVEMTLFANQLIIQASTVLETRGERRALCNRLLVFDHQRPA